MSSRKKEVTEATSVILVLDKSKTYFPLRLSTKLHQYLLSVSINRKSVGFISVLLGQALSLAEINDVCYYCHLKTSVLHTYEIEWWLLPSSLRPW